MAMRDRERGTVFWSFGYPENIDQTHQVGVKISSDQRNLSSQPEIPGTKTNNMVRSPYIYFPSTLNINSRRARHTYAPHT